MTIQECKGKIKHAVGKMCKEKGVTVLRDRESTTDLFPDSLSMYFELEYNGIKKTIRISNHTRQHIMEGQSKMISSIIIKKSTSFSHIERFIANRISDIKRVSLYVKLDKLSQAA